MQQEQEEKNSNTQLKALKAAKEIEELQNQKKELEAKLQADSATSEQLKLNLLSSKEQIIDLEQALACQKSDLSESQQSKADQLEKFDTERSELLLKVKGVENKIKEHVRTIDDLTSTNKRQQEDKVQFQNSIVELKAQGEELNSCIASLEHDKSKLCHQLEASSSQTSALEQEIQDLRAQLQSLRKHILDQQDVIDISKE